MEQLSGSSRPTSAQYEEQGNPKKRGWDLADDTSSIATSSSMNSEKREKRDTECKKCHQLSTATRELFKCQKCKYRYHRTCHIPVPPEEDFICANCTKRMQAEAPYSSNAAFKNTPEASEASRSKRVIPNRSCEIDGCNNMALSTGVRKLCHPHNIAEKYKKAASMTPMPIVRPDREFDKKKLYRPNPADKELIVNDKKRKRARIPDDMQSFRVDATSPKNKRVRARAPSSTSGPRMHESSRRRAVESFVSNAVQSGVINSLTNAIPTRESAFAASDTGKFSRYDSARASPILGEEESPEYTPPPALSDKSPWVEPEVIRALEAPDRRGSINSPGSQIIKESQAMIDDDDNITGEDEAEVNGALQQNQSVINDDEGDISNVAENEARDTEAKELEADAGNQSDNSIRDASELRIAQGPNEDIDTPDFPVNSINNTRAEEEEEEEEEAEVIGIENLSIENLDLMSEYGEILESIGSPLLKPEYDSSVLDSFLYPAAQNFTHSYRPNLLRSQKWGAIDPRVSWPKRLSADEYAEKQVEIAARGTRKQNFGKLLTKQVRDERRDKGWDIHQSREWDFSEAGEERERRLKELFGLTRMDFSGFVPGIKDGRLAMVEREDVDGDGGDGTGRRRKKASRACLVNGAP